MIVVIFIVGNYWQNVTCASLYSFAGWGREDWTGRENLIPRASLLPVHSRSRERDRGNKVWVAKSKKLDYNAVPLKHLYVVSRKP